MNRSTALAALFLVSLAAGIWLFRPVLPMQPGAGASCDADEICSAATAAHSGEQATEVEAAPGSTEIPGTAPQSAAGKPLSPPPASAPPPARPRAFAIDGKALRAEADRLLAEGNVLPGIEKLREATEADPTPKNHGDLGDLLARLTALDEALVHLRQAADLDPGNADRWIALANAYYRAVNPGEAWKAEKRAQEAEPGLVLGRDKNGRRVRQGDSEPRKP
jgi:hypothetical protein